MYGVDGCRNQVLSCSVPAARALAGHIRVTTIEGVQEEAANFSRRISGTMEGADQSAVTAVRV
ncbi:MAG: hypothetical protein ACLTS6_16945 [Anaerobutyricum sp.]